METGEGGGEKQADSGGEKRDIRRPMNAFLIFCKRHRSMVREKHPDRDNRSVTRILGDLWANLPDDEKAVYTNLAKTYKDAFMKANPDYKWHSTDRLPQPGKMATRPTNVRPPRSLSASDTPPLGLSDGDKMGGVNLLLLAGKQSMPLGDQLSSLSSSSSSSLTSVSLDSKLGTAADSLMGANSALLQLAEMCSSSEVAGRHLLDPVSLCSAPPKKRARHWSHSDALLNELVAPDNPTLPPTPLFFHTLPSHTPAKPVLPPSTTHTAKPVPSPTATLIGQGEAGVERREVVFRPSGHLGVGVEWKEVERVSAFRPVESSGLMASVKHVAPPPPAAASAALRKEETGNAAKPDVAARAQSFSAGVGMPPKKKFTKLHDRYKGDRQTTTTTPTTTAGGNRPVSTTSTMSSSTTTAATTEGGCLSDQNDNAIFTCGKLVVDHIIDRLFSASLTPSQQDCQSAGGGSPSVMDIERVRRIITADITERERSLQGPSSSNKDVGRLLSEVVQKPQNLVEKVIEEAYNMDLTRRVVQPEPPTPTPVVSNSSNSESVPRPPTRNVDEAEVKPALLPKPAALLKSEKVSRLDPIPEQTGHGHEVRHDAATPVTSAPLSPLHAASSSDPDPSPGKTPPPLLPPITVREEREEGGEEAGVGGSHLYKEEAGDYLPEEEEGYSQPVRKSRRRNRGQRYQELINEGIIQPSKERLAARRHEQTPAMAAATTLSSSMFLTEDMLEDDSLLTDKARQALKRSNSEVEQGSADDKRYRTGDFDLEAEIATLPPCSLDQVPRRRGPRKRSDSESGRRPPLSPSQMKEESSSPEPGFRSASPSSLLSSVVAACMSQPMVCAEPLTGSQKRKARKHSINRLVASTTDSGSKAKPPGIEATIPMVRDATVSPVTNAPQSVSTTAAREASATTTAASTVCSLSSASVSSSVTSREEKYVPSDEEKLPPQTVNLPQGKNLGLENHGDRTLKSENSLTAEEECCDEERKTFSVEQKLARSVDVVQTTTAVSTDVRKPDAMKSSVDVVQTTTAVSTDVRKPDAMKSSVDVVQTTTAVSTDVRKPDAMKSSVDVVQTTTAVSTDVGKPDAMKSSVTDKANPTKNKVRLAAKPKSEESVGTVPAGNLSDDGANEIQKIASEEKKESFRGDVLKESIAGRGTKSAPGVQGAETKNSGTDEKHHGTDVANIGMAVNAAKQASFSSTSGSGSTTGREKGSSPLTRTLSSDGGGASENSVREGDKGEGGKGEGARDGGKAEGKRPQRCWPLKKALSSDSSQCSGLEESEDAADRETSLEAREGDGGDRPSFFLSETSGLLCLSQQTPPHSSQCLESADTWQSQESVSKNSSALTLESIDEEPVIGAAELTPSVDEDEEDCGDVMEDTAAASVAMDDLLDNGVVLSMSSSESLGQGFSPFSSSGTATTGPRVTTVTMTTSDALPTALSLEMMEEEGMVDSGRGGNPMLCGSPMPESPSMTAVHS